MFCISVLIISTSQSHWKKIQEWLLKNIPWPKDMLKSELLTSLSSVKKEFEAYINSSKLLNDIAIKFWDYSHITLNWILLCLSGIKLKGCISLRNLSFEIDKVEKLMQKQPFKMSCHRIGKSHAIKEEKNMEEMNNLIENTIGSLYWN